jgi:hypothetical protein
MAGSKHPQRRCGACDKALSSVNSSGYCRQHFASALHADADRKAAKYAKRSVTMSEPERREKHLAHLRAIGTIQVDRWCPLEYRDEYRFLTRVKCFRASEARALIDAKILVDHRRYLRTGKLQQAVRG